MKFEKVETYYIQVIVLQKLFILGLFSFPCDDLLHCHSIQRKFYPSILSMFFF